MVSMANQKSKLRARLARGRCWVQTAFLLAWLDPLMIRMHTVCGPVFHCYSCPWATFACPIGVLANFSLGDHALRGPRNAAGGGGRLRQLRVRLGLPLRLLAGRRGLVPTRKFALPAWLSGLRYVVLAVFVLFIPFLWGEAHPLFFAASVPPARWKGRCPTWAAGHGGRGDRVAHGHEVDDPWPVLRFHAFHLAAVVHAVLPAGGDLRTDEPRFVSVPPLSSG